MVSLLLLMLLILLEEVGAKGSRHREEVGGKPEDV